MSTAQLEPVNLVFCGPNDVSKEIAIAKDVVGNWNRLHAEARGIWIKHHHWLTDVYPDLAKRAQDVPNRQIIDPARILVAIFWSRFGTPTGIADSGTQEEILRAADRGKMVMVYFSDLEPMPADTDTRQLELLWQFRQSLRLRSISWSFKSRDEFSKLFENHLSLALNAFEAQPRIAKPAREGHPIVSQKARTNEGNIFQFVDNRTYQRPATEKTVRERRPGSVSTEEVKQIGEWIKNLAEGEVDKTRDEAFAMWGGRFKNHFHLGHREDLPSSKMTLAEAWYRRQKAIQKSDYKRKAPDLYQCERVKSIKAAMNKMGRTNEDYYPELSARLKLKKPFPSLKRLTKRNLGRVYNMVRTDLKKWGTS